MASVNAAIPIASTPQRRKQGSCRHTRKVLALLGKEITEKQKGDFDPFEDGSANI